MTEEIDVVFKEPKPFKQTLKPIIYFAWLMGTGSGRPGDRKKCTIVIKFFHYTMCSAVIAWGVIDFFMIGSILPSEMFKIMYYTNKAVVYVTSYYYVSLSLVKYKNWRRFVEQIESIDSKIRREITLKDRGTKILQILALLATIIFGPISALVHILYYLFTTPDDIYTSDVLLYYIISLSLTTNLWFDVVVCNVYQRFKIVNKLIIQIGDSYTAPWIVIKLQRIKEMHYGICGLVRILNDIHGIHLLLSSANCFMTVIATLFRIYIGVVELKFDFILANNVIWIIYATQFALNCYVCTLTCREAAGTGILIHEVGLKNNQFNNRRIYSRNLKRSMSYQPEAKTYEGSSIQNEIAYFSSQLQQYRVSFSACGLFEIDNALLQGFIGVITTYLIILIQFYKAPEQGPAKILTVSEAANISIANSTEEYFTTDEF